MEIVNFGLFTPRTEAGIVLFANEDGEDWYALRDGLTNWDKSNGAFINAVYGAWAMVDPSTMRVTNVEYDPSRLMPGNRIVLGIDASVKKVKEGMLYSNGALLDTPAPPTVSDVVTERTRRLALGFNYNFSDARGTHRIATTDADMQNWDEVSKLAAALLAVGKPGQKISIKTETGSCEVTALEWQSILIAAGAFRQPLFAASFRLQAAKPIPGDYATNDNYWG